MSGTLGRRARGETHRLEVEAAVQNESDEGEGRQGANEVVEDDEVELEAQIQSYGISGQLDCNRRSGEGEELWTESHDAIRH